MDTSHLDLSRFRKMTREEYYTTDWKITEEEAKFAQELDDLTPYERHNRCHEYADRDGKFQASDAWNLWASHYRERYLEQATPASNKGLFETKKQLKNYFYKRNNNLHINFGSNETNKSTIKNLICNCFIFPFFVNFNSLIINRSSSFKRARFLGYINFSDTEFRNSVSFNSTCFYGIANFENVNFNSTTHFVYSKFFDRADFRKVKFIGSTFFTSVDFYEDAMFIYLTVSTQLKFKYSVFWRMVDFSNTEIGASLTSIYCIFGGDFNFKDIDAEKAVEFTKSCFLAETTFTGTIFRNAAIFYHCAVGKITDNQIHGFTESRIKKFPNEYRYNPCDAIIPDFTATIFEIPPNLSFIDFPSPDEINDDMAAAKFRRLKELAEIGKNHLSETQFFRYEMLCRRGHEVSDLFSWFISAYDHVSKFGLSVWRPTAYMFGILTTFWFLYMAIYYFTGMTDGYSQYNVTKYYALDMFKYSFHNILPVLSSTEPEKTVVINALFGGYEHRPWYFGALAFIQNILGLGLLFLILLGIRNYFRMR